ncbi:MAG TPA: phosphoribosylglycinamide synthetase C domain-containing protein, partial [Ignavibacteria bacterium]|nr:phosphoribosylglycinamide synthetase C domain-containing protein [Ignavibacteria bacterium]
FQMGTKYGTIENENEIVTAGGRVISVVGISERSLEDAVSIAYKESEKIVYENKYFRRDIGSKQISNFKTSLN